MSLDNPDLSIALAHLLRGPLHAEDQPPVWNTVTSQGLQLRDHLRPLGLRLVIDDVERYAYLRAEDDLPEGMPRLVRRHALTFGATILLILLRQQLATAESDGQTPRLIVTGEEMVESLRLYHRDGTSYERIAGDINVLEKLGYLRRLRDSENTYEARRIIKAIVTADWIAEYSQQLLAATQTTPDQPDDAGSEPADAGADADVAPTDREGAPA